MASALRSILGAATLVVATAGCGFFFEPKPDVGTPNHYAEHGLVFDYPGNWKATTEHEVIEGTDTVMITVESAGSGIAMVQQFKPAVSIEPDEMLALLTAEMRTAAGEQLGGAMGFQQGSATTTTRKMLGEDRPTRRASFVVSLVGEKVPHTFELVMANLDDRTLVVLQQGPDEDLKTIQPAFDQILSTLALK